MNHDAFYVMGNKIISQNNDNLTEAEIRTAIGRIYYYIYHEVLSWVNIDDSMKVVYSESEIKSTHKKLINVFFEMAKSTKNLQYGKISRLLSTLHSYRCLADYQLNDPVDKALFESMQANLEDLKEACLGLKNDLFEILNIKTIETIGAHKTQSATLEVRKRTLRLLD